MRLNKRSRNYKAGLREGARLQSMTDLQRENEILGKKAALEKALKEAQGQLHIFKSKLNGLRAIARTTYDILDSMGVD